jgi:hypothetical protein
MSSIKSVMRDGSPLSVAALAIRYCVYLRGGLVPVVGPLFGLVNALFIFGRQRRSLHDRAANIVVQNWR